MHLPIQSETKEGTMEVDEDIPAPSNSVEEEDFGDLFKQHNYYLQDHAFDSDDSHPWSSHSDSDFDRIMPHFEELEFSDSDDDEQGLEGDSEGVGLDLLDDPLFQSWGSIFSGGGSEDEEDWDEVDDEYLSPTFEEHPAIQNAYI